VAVLCSEAYIYTDVDLTAIGVALAVLSSVAIEVTLVIDLSGPSHPMRAKETSSIRMLGYWFALEVALKSVLRYVPTQSTPDVVCG
jgi:hypothetical protein